MTFDKGDHILKILRKKTGYHTKPDQFSCMAKFSKTDPGSLPHSRWSSLQQLVMVESCKMLHLKCNKVLGSAPDF